MKTRRSFLKTLVALPAAILAAKAAADLLPEGEQLDATPFHPGKEVLVLLVHGAKFIGHNVAYDRTFERTVNFSMVYGDDANMRRRLRENRYRFQSTVFAVVREPRDLGDHAIHVIKHRFAKTPNDTTVASALSDARVLPWTARLVAAYPSPEYGPDAIIKAYAYQKDTARWPDESQSEAIVQAQLGIKHGRGKV